MARAGRGSAEGTPVRVPSADRMYREGTLRLHIEARHTRLGFVTRGEHAADHRLGRGTDHEHVPDEG